MYLEKHHVKWHKIMLDNGYKLHQGYIHYKVCNDAVYWVLFPTIHHDTKELKTNVYFTEFSLHLPLHSLFNEEIKFSTLFVDGLRYTYKGSSVKGMPHLVDKINLFCENFQMNNLTLESRASIYFSKGIKSRSWNYCQLIYLFKKDKNQYKKRFDELVDHFYLITMNMSEKEKQYTDMKDVILFRLFILDSYLNLHRYSSFDGLLKEFKTDFLRQLEEETVTEFDEV